MNSWEKCYSRNGSPYYLNYKNMKSQWEHPYFGKILTDAADYNDVIYAAYRTALKLLHIRNNLYLHSFDVEKITSAFSEIIPPHCINIDEYLSISRLDEAIAALYLCCDTTLSESVWTGAVSSCLLYFFDGKKRGTVNTLSVLVFLTMLCSDKLTNKYTFLFECLSQHNLVGPQDISHLKNTVFTVLTQLQEDKAYKTAYEGNGTTMTKDMFLKWLLSEPKFIVWLSTLHRIHAAVSVRHIVRCYRCKNSPIVGLRYRCLQCFNVDMCFQCFTRIPAYGKHDKSHSIEEYCVPSNKMQDVKAFIAKLRNNVKKKSKHSRSIEFDLTASRHPAMVWHEPRSDAGCCTFANGDISHTPMTSPEVDRRSSLHRGSDVDGYHSLTRRHMAQANKDESRIRYCQSLPRRSKMHSTVLSPIRVSDAGTTQSNQSPYRNTVSDGNPYSQPIHSTPYKSPTTDYSHSTARHPEAAIYNQPEFIHNRSSRVKRDPNLEFYTPTSQIANGLELDFYSSTVRHAVPYNPSIHNHDIRQKRTPSAKRSHNMNTFSEDEGIVVNSESDSCVSQFTTFDNRDNYKVPGQSSQSKYNDTLSKHDTATRGSRGSAPPYDYSKYAWDETKEATYEFMLTTNQRASYQNTNGSIRQKSEKARSGTYQKVPRQVVDGIRVAVVPIIRAYQV